VASGHDPPLPDREIDCDVSRIVAADLRTVDALARLQLALHRAGGRMRLCGTSAELRDLLDLVGLRGPLGLEAVGEAEEREEARRVEEEDDPGDAVT
jgi:hypothetical protein